jgi:heme-degrading monooxygenase HmoA
VVLFLQKRNKTGRVKKAIMKQNFKPYYAVIFTSTQTKKSEGYAEMAQQMETLAKQQKGFLGMDSAKNASESRILGTEGITVSYWKTLDDIKNWKQQSDHLVAQQKGIKDWYSWYNVKICKVEREYEFGK